MSVCAPWDGKDYGRTGESRTQTKQNKTTFQPHPYGGGLFIVYRTQETLGQCKPLTSKGEPHRPLPRDDGVRGGNLRETDLSEYRHTPPVPTQSPRARSHLKRPQLIGGVGSLCGTEERHTTERRVFSPTFRHPYTGTRCIRYLLTTNQKRVLRQTMPTVVGRGP